MAIDRETVERLAAQIRAQRDEAEATASNAAERLVREASGIKRLAEVDQDQIRAMADDFAGALGRLKVLEEMAGELRRLLM